MKFRVKSTLIHDGEEFAVGSTVELSEEQAASLGDAIEPLKAAKKAAESGDAAEGAGAESK